MNLIKFELDHFYVIQLIMMAKIYVKNKLKNLKFKIMSPVEFSTFQNAQ